LTGDCFFRRKIRCPALTEYIATEFVRSMGARGGRWPCSLFDPRRFKAVKMTKPRAPAGDAVAGAVV